MIIKMWSSFHFIHYLVGKFGWSVGEPESNSSFINNKNEFFVWITLMFYSFVGVQLHAFLISKILQGHVWHLVLHNMRKLSHKLVRKKKKGKEREVSKEQVSQVLASDTDPQMVP